jgi:hypothetical protein
VRASELAGRVVTPCDDPGPGTVGGLDVGEVGGDEVVVVGGTVVDVVLVVVGVEGPQLVNTLATPA